LKQSIVRGNQVGGSRLEIVRLGYHALSLQVIDFGDVRNVKYGLNVPRVLKQGSENGVQVCDKTIAVDLVVWMRQARDEWANANHHLFDVT
jgi:hypothetical protein